jgi:hypothetical protein
MNKKILYPLLMVLAVLLCYLNSFQVPFLWDDEVMIVGNSLIRGLLNLRNIFFSGAFGSVASGGDFYRPFQILTYLFDHSLWGLDARGFHLTSLLVHLGSTLLLYWLALQLFNCRAIALMSALLWGVHPINIEAVTYLSGRGDLLSIFLVLASANLYLQGRLKNCWYHLPAFLLYIIALFSKENALPFPLILIALEFLLIQKKKGAMTYIALGAMNLAMIAYILTRLFFISTTTMRALSIIAGATVLERVMTLPWILFTSLRYLAFPWPSHMEYHFLVSTFSDYRLYLPLLLVLLTIPLLRSKKYKKITVFSILCLVLGLAPVSHIFLPLAATFREHWLIIPSLGLFLLLAFALQALSPAHRRIRVIVFSILAVAWGTLTIVRNNDWISPMRLYTHDLKHEPKSFLLHNNAGVEYFRLGNMEEAQKHFQSAIDTAPGKGYSMAFNNMGVIYQRQGDLARAKELYLISLEISPDKLAYLNLAAILINENNIKKASSYLEEALKTYPYDPELLELKSSIDKSQN